MNYKKEGKTSYLLQLSEPEMMMNFCLVAVNWCREGERERERKREREKLVDSGYLLDMEASAFVNRSKVL